MIKTRIQGLRHWLRGLAPRERSALLAMCAVIALALLWRVGVAPAWRTLREVPQQQARLAPQLHTMRAWAAEAALLRSRQQRRPQAAERQRALAAATQQHLGPQVVPAVQGDQATVVLTSVPATALAAWLEDVRVHVQAVPVDVQLTRVAAGSGTSAPTEARWGGTIVLAGLGQDAP